jgi:hypothetical protein
MITVCRICGLRLENNELTCSDKCSEEYKRRREVALSRIRAIQELKEKRRKPRKVIVSTVVRTIAQVLLEQGVPTFAPSADLDRRICEAEPMLKELTPSFRKKQITTHVSMVHYKMYTRSGKGKTTFMLQGDKDVVRRNLEQIIRSQGMTS